MLGLDEGHHCAESLLCAFWYDHGTVSDCVYCGFDQGIVGVTCAMLNFLVKKSRDQKSAYDELIQKSLVVVNI